MSNSSREDSPDWLRSFQVCYFPFFFYFNVSYPGYWLIKALLGRPQLWHCPLTQPHRPRPVLIGMIRFILNRQRKATILLVQLLLMLHPIRFPNQKGELRRRKEKVKQDFFLCYLYWSNGIGLCLYGSYITTICKPCLWWFFTFFFEKNKIHLVLVFNALFFWKWFRGWGWWTRC